MARHGKDRRKQDAGGKQKVEPAVPAVIAADQAAPVVVTADGAFGLEDPALPDWVEKRALKSGGFPHDRSLRDKVREQDLTRLQIELVKLQRHVNDAGRRVVALFEGRDAAGKGGSIFAMRQCINPRTASLVALPRPSERERGQWYFQRYLDHLPTAGELVPFDRSWYNRGGVEAVMGFGTASERRTFLKQAPGRERMLVDQGIVVLKFWLEIGREMQLKRFHERHHDPLKIWKLSPIDTAALTRWDAYTTARDTMIAATHRRATPWTIVHANDKQRARLNIIRQVLAAIDCPGKDADVVGRTDPLILGGPELLRH